MSKKIIGFSKLSKQEKIEWICSNYLDNSKEDIEILDKYLNNDINIQSIHDTFSENTLSNFYFPFSVAPNFLINNKNYCLPMVIEESSVIAAASNSAKFWYDKGGFRAKVISSEKIGQIHFLFNGEFQKIKKFIDDSKSKLIDATSKISSKMIKRGGGINSINLIDMSRKYNNYYQLSISFNTVDSMGANFINSCLEIITKKMCEEIKIPEYLTEKEKDINIIMSILSNSTPNCIVKANAECQIDEIGEINGLNSKEFAEKFFHAVEISKIDLGRAVTNNKGIMNGVDSILISTGNDFRAVEASVHSFACKDGEYKGLTECSIDNNIFSIKLTLPISIGTVGGITDLHPMVKLSHKLLGKPNSSSLMEIIASAGLAQNFAAIKSLITAGIQKGHMKMHLINLLKKNNATENQIENAKVFFKEKKITSKAVQDFLNLN
ncbi:MAG: hydroxymethylglutaryl-CoA reductase [Flavobacteriales bacterium]|jgi:hydroxymethylglutaryl-CoA reductase|nr:hydroxymethylglutaryl-CoA reductase [Flavobacteriales bacterium]